MKGKQWALFFICMLSADYMTAIVNAARGRCCKRRVRQTGCRLKPQLIRILDEALENCRTEMPDTLPMDDTQVDRYEMTEGEASGFKNFRRKPYRCICGKNLVRIFVEVSFLRILITYVLTLLDDLLGGLLGELGSALVGVLGNVVNLLLRILALDITVQFTLVQRFIPGTRCVVEDYRVSRLTNIRLLNLNLAPVAELLSPLLTPVLDLVLQLIFNGRVREIFVREFQRIIIRRDMIICS